MKLYLFCVTADKIINITLRVAVPDWETQQLSAQYCLENNNNNYISVAWNEQSDVQPRHTTECPRLSARSNELSNLGQSAPSLTGNNWQQSGRWDLFLVGVSHPRPPPASSAASWNKPCTPGMEGRVGLDYYWWLASCYWERGEITSHSLHQTQIFSSSTRDAPL